MAVYLRPRHQLRIVNLNFGKVIDLYRLGNESEKRRLCAERTVYAKVVITRRLSTDRVQKLLNQWQAFSVAKGIRTESEFLNMWSDHKHGEYLEFLLFDWS